MSTERERSWRDVVFASRGALLAIPAAALVVAGRPTRRSVAAGVPLAFAGEALRCWAVGYSGVTTREARVTAPQLVTAGPYAHVRNPLYLANALTALGFTVAYTGAQSFAERAGFLMLGLGAMFGVYAAIVPLEEAFLAATFGEAFADYVAAVPRLVPRRDAYPRAEGAYDPRAILRAESRTFVTFGAMLAALAVKALDAPDA